jgi:hypothetical protein
MEFLKRIFTSQRSPDWERAPGDMIWKLLPTPAGILVGESRDPERKTMSLFAVEVASGEMLFSGKGLDEPWWIALELTIGEIAVLHRYPRPDLPNAIGATIVDCRNGEVLWSNDNIRIICGIDEIALALRGAALDTRQLLFLDARTGAVIEEIGDDMARAQEFQNICAERSVLHGWVNSEPFSDDHPRFDSLSRIIRREIVEQRGEAHVAEYGDFTVIGAHERSRRSADAMLQGRVDSVLLLLDGDRVVYSERIATDATAPADDLFFIWNGKLMFIRDRRVLAAINLEQE